MKNFATEQEKRFREWMRCQFREDGARKYTDNAIIAYCYALRTACAKMENPLEENLFDISEDVQFQIVYDKILSAEDFEKIDKENGNGTFHVALKLYKIFLEKGEVTESQDLNAPFYVKKSLIHDSYSEDRGAEFHYVEVPMTPVQKIYYGAPGTGKSYKVRQMLAEEYPDAHVRDAHCRRLIFHPTYTYADFVGSIKPLVSLDKPLDYIYAAGPFTSLLKDAFMRPAEKFYLIIEEINRGNAPAVFGDLFQLLDRQEDGKSVYAVQNVDIAAYFSRDPGLKRLFNDGKIWLPANFNIFATMNTADENIFVLDSAFKRRFTLEYVCINFEDMPDGWREENETFAGELSLEVLFEGTAVGEFVHRLKREGKLKRNWPTFARIVNYIIDILNKDVILKDKPELARIPENKKLGPFFVADCELVNRASFINKVIFYLKQDVFTYSNHYMKDSYEDIYLKYMDRGEDLFELLK